MASSVQADKSGPGPLSHDEQYGSLGLVGATGVWSMFSGLLEAFKTIRPKGN